MLENVKNPTDYAINTFIIDNFFHECLHATDLDFSEEDSKINKFGFCNIINNVSKLDEKDTMFNEYANVISSSLISSDKPMYEEDLGIYVYNNGSYARLNLPGSIMCSTFSMSEIEMAKWKDKGRDSFETYLQDKFPCVNAKQVLDAFGSSLNVIHNSRVNKDKENETLGLKNMIDISLCVMDNRIKQIQLLDEGEETLERTYFDLYKIDYLLAKEQFSRMIDGESDLDEGDGRYNTIQEMKGKLESYRKNDRDKEFNVREIAKKYYVPTNEPMNDNTKLIKQIRRDLRKQRIKEKLSQIVGRIRRIKALPEGNKEKATLVHANDIKQFKNRIKYETPIVHRNTDIEKQEDMTKDEKGIEWE